MRTSLAVPLSAAAAGAAVVGYGAGYEVRSFRLRTAVVPVLPAGAAPVRVLHISDMHLSPLQRRKQEWVRALDRLDPDLVINTGDTLSHAEALGELKYALGPLLERPGAFVLGSNDRYAPIPKNPARYLLTDTGMRKLGPGLPWQSARDAMAAHGWVDLTNAEGRLRVGELEVAVAGVDDPHIGLDRYDAIAGPLDPSADLHLGVTHSPEPRVLDRFAADGYPLIFAGHTHGGQLRVPFYGALVTNCGLDRRRARGLSRYDSSWLHVSAGLGTSPYAPVRIACPPEATLLTLLPVR
ncbi:MAG: metallophosphoesterase [Actinomycetota bacterium]|nr:metallophosphoesterase [Actinomycetota bacterium]